MLLAICAAQHSGGLMGDIVNLKRFKKRAARDQAAKDAQAQRARFGRTKAERQAGSGTKPQTQFGA